MCRKTVLSPRRGPPGGSTRGVLRAWSPSPHFRLVAGPAGLLAGELIGHRTTKPQIYQRAPANNVGRGGESKEEHEGLYERRRRTEKDEKVATDHKAVPTWVPPGSPKRGENFP
jgi:hypothetical protein